MFLTTHYLDEADALCDRLAIIDHGQIVVEGTPDELKRQIAGDVVTIGVADRAADVLRLVEAQEFVREAGTSDGLVRAYVDQGRDGAAGVAPAPGCAGHGTSDPVAPSAVAG